MTALAARRTPGYGSDPLGAIARQLKQARNNARSTLLARASRVGAHGTEQKSVCMADSDQVSRWKRAMEGNTTAKAVRTAATRRAILAGPDEAGVRFPDDGEVQGHGFVR